MLQSDSAKHRRVLRALVLFLAIMAVPTAISYGRLLTLQPAPGSALAESVSAFRLDRFSDVMHYQNRFNYLHTSQFWYVAAADTPGWYPFVCAAGYSRCTWVSSTGFSPK